MKILRLTIMLFFLFSNWIFANATINTDNNLGKTIYESSCQNCHSPKLSIGIKAPAAFDKNAWSLRIDKADKQSHLNKQYANGLDYLIKQVTIGKGLMHHGGLCKEANNPEFKCSCTDYVAAIEYMSGHLFTAKDKDVIKCE